MKKLIMKRYGRRERERGWLRALGSSLELYQGIFSNTHRYIYANILAGCAERLKFYQLILTGFRGAQDVCLILFEVIVLKPYCTAEQSVLCGYE